MNYSKTTFSAIFFLSLVFPVVHESQIICSTDSLSVAVNDEPPGCFWCHGVLNGSNREFTSDSIDIVFPCGETENSLWITYENSSLFLDAFDLSTQNCDQGGNLEISVYDNDFNLVSALSLIHI